MSKLKIDGVKPTMLERQEFYDLYCRNLKDQNDSSEDDGPCKNNYAMKQFMISEEYGEDGNKLSLKDKILVNQGEL